MPGDEAFDGIAGEGLSGPGGEQRVAGAAAALGEPGAEDCGGLPGQRGGAANAYVAAGATDPGGCRESREARLSNRSPRNDGGRTTRSFSIAS